MKRGLKTLVAILIAGLLIFAVTLFYTRRLQNRKQAENHACVSRAETRTVRGGSLAGLIEEGAEVKILNGYYECNEVGRGDVVAYNFPGNPEPIIKIVKAVPGDKFKLKSEGSAWRMVVNGRIVKNSTGQPYALDERAYRLLSLYVNDYKGVIPAGAYLLLGNISTGSADSTRFGLVDKSDFAGKVVLE